MHGPDSSFIATPFANRVDGDDYYLRLDDTIDYASLPLRDSLSVLAADPDPGHGNIYINSGDKMIHYLAGGYWHRITVKDSTLAFCSAYRAVYNAMTNKPTNAIAVQQNLLVQTLITGGVWAKLDLFYLFANYSNTAGESYLNWVNNVLYTATNTGATAWTTLEGFTGDGAGDHLHLNFNPSTNAVNFTKDACSMGVYMRLDKTEDGVAMGVGDGTQQATIIPRYSAGSGMVAYLNSIANGSDATVATGSGFFIITRQSSSTNVVDLGDVAITSTTIPNGDFHILGLLGGEYSTNQISVAFLGGALSNAEVTIMNDAVEVYMDSNAKGVE
jgi:hypothetical protein